MMKHLLVVGVVLVTAMAAPTAPKANELKDFPLDEVVPTQFTQNGFDGSWLTGLEYNFVNEMPIMIYSTDYRERVTVP